MSIDDCVDMVVSDRFYAKHSFYNKVTGEHHYEVFWNTRKPASERPYDSKTLMSQEGVLRLYRQDLDSRTVNPYNMRN